MRSSLVVASTLVLGVIASPRNLFSVLEKRQSSSNPYPTQCNSACQPLQAALGSCADDQCFCTATNIQNFAACLQCTANIIGDVPDLQSSLTEVVNDCNSEGFKVPSETLTGGTGGGAPTGGSSPTFSFSSPAGVTSSVGGNSPFPTASNSVPNAPSSPTQTAGGSLPPLGGSNPQSPQGGSSSAVGLGVPRILVGTIVGGIALAIAL